MLGSARIAAVEVSAVKKGLIVFLVVAALIVLVSPGIIGRIAEESVDESFQRAAQENDEIVVTSEAFSREKRDHMEALGATLTLLESPTGGTTKDLTLRMIATAKELAETPGSFWADQLNNECRSIRR